MGFPEAVIFDVDGVLLDSERIFYRAVRETLLSYGIDMGEGGYAERWMIKQSGMRGVVRDYSLDKKDITAEQLIKTRDEMLYRLIDQELEMMPHAQGLLDMAYGKCPLGIASSDTRANVLKKLGKFSLEPMFRVIVTDDDVVNRKPHPEPCQKAVDLLGAYPGNTVVIEDNPSGLKSAKGVKPVGCRVIAYPNGFTVDMDFSEADIVVSSLAEINEEMLNSLSA